MNIFIIISTALFFLDQLTKQLVVKFISYGHSVAIIKAKSFFNIVNISNSGVAFSMLQGRNMLFSILISVFLITIVYYIYKNKNKFSKLEKYSYCLIISGGTGNLYDRLTRGAVVDFLDFGINSLRWPSFNIADSCICAAAGLFILDITLRRKKTNEQNS
ncbi:MAG: signal peptidase II [Elusimicrobiota bacterium]|jgi:signal peptidase II|nr:signal peptidase II [Elusimicrobiota bacterium]